MEARSLPPETAATQPDRRASFNVLLSPEEYKMLDTLAEAEARSRGAVIRVLLRRAYRMTAEGEAICASGTPCPYAAPRPAGPVVGRMTR